MRDFEFIAPTRIYFGKSSENELLYELRKYGKNVLLVYGGGSIKKSGLYENVAVQLREEGARVIELSGVQPNPRLSLVRKGIDLVKANDVDLILAVGGGSVIDTAKAISFGAVSDKDVWEYFENNSAPHKALPLGVVSTIAASGSETSNSCVITNDQSNLKRGVNAECFIPKFAVLNPERTMTLPKYQTSCGSADILAHLLERYFTPDKFNAVTDALLIAAIRTLIKYAKVLVDYPDNYDARAQVMYLAAIAHNNSLSVGRLGDWGSHKIEHALSAYNDMAHGEGLAIVFPAWMQYVYETNPAAFAKLGVEVFDIPQVDKTNEQLTYETITAFTDFFKTLGLKTRLREVNVPETALKDIAENALYHYDHIGAFKPLYAADVYQILKIAY